ncbi:putative molybdenum cofactor biosynthesis protein A, archaeal [Methanomethylovorans hollandica DSM 15978]|uniref:Probable GTP 3',8-cyclase n=1 Tax=Methanomethylovorans hollandica (strain DSM 15978 / NBRC 107637 / DMS1) TaxID=867904 RepID=L0KTG8_METHD|nr:GTP 3',8-cyclase MoaA [Methanomethylovorans hollandica]AGB48732.1 putative molybdenum cofactor biosynthesis protein A, archaeal [Methanomethylovorans hollandica DSM 15978]
MNAPHKMDFLTDAYGRTIKSLRMSVTDRCNLNCIYCHNEGSKGNTGEMSVETISSIVHVAADFGISRLKISGGEPLLRKDLEDILLALPPLKDVSLTTNGVLLRERARSLKDAGLNRVNISLDSLDEGKYKHITKCKDGTFGKVIEGIHAAVDAGLTPVKLNMVLLKDVNESEVEGMLSFARQFHGGVILQLIQLMDFGDVASYHADVDEVEKELELKAGCVQVRELHHRKKYIIDGAEVEFVKPVDNTEFCANCNRLRVTADGKLRACLLVNDGLVDVSHASVEEMSDLFRLAVSRRVPFYRK